MAAFRPPRAKKTGRNVERFQEATTGGKELQKDGVTDGTRTRNSQNHNLELYH
jgi:hypothetical protein